MRGLRILRRLVGVLAVCAALGIASRPAGAEVQAKHWNFGYEIGGTFLSRDLGADNLSQTLRAGYNFTPWIGLEGAWAVVRTEDATQDDLDSDLDFYSLDLLYHFRPDGESVAYTFLGAGVVRLDLERASGDSFRDSAFFWEGGAGVKIPANRWIDIRFDVRLQRYRLDREVATPAPLNGTLSDDRFISRAFTFGVGWHFPAVREGRREAPAKEEEPEKPAAPPAPPPAPAAPPAPPQPAAPAEPAPEPPAQAAPSEPVPSVEPPEAEPAPPEEAAPSEPAPPEPSEAPAPEEPSPEEAEPAPEPPAEAPAPPPPPSR